MHTYKYILLVFYFFITMNGWSQLSIFDCQMKAKENYPLLKSLEIIDKTKEYNIENINRMYLPQISLIGKTSYQSEVVELPLKIPGVELQGLSKDQYNAYLEINQILYDGGSLKHQKATQTKQSDIDKTKFEIDIITLNERVNQNFFSILLIEEQIILTQMVLNEINDQYNKLLGLQQNGLANKHDLNLIKAEQIKYKQKENDLNFMRATYIQIMGIYINDSNITQQKFKKPDLFPIIYDVNNRPELTMFQQQMEYFDFQIRNIKANNIPKLNAFAQTGYGRPGLNMLNNSFDTYYIAGIRLNWNISNLYTSRNNVKKFELNKEHIQLQKNNFTFQINLKISQIKQELNKIAKQIELDGEMISIRKEIKESTIIKVETGTASTYDLIRDVNAEQMAKQEKALHEIQYLITLMNLKQTLHY